MRNLSRSSATECLGSKHGWPALDRHAPAHICPMMNEKRMDTQCAMSRKVKVAPEESAPSGKEAKLELRTHTIAATTCPLRSER
jgi:hypothetical protein